VPGHEVIGRVAELGKDALRFSKGDRVGVGWIYSSSGGADENLSPEFRATGRDVNGGYAEYMVVGEDYAYAIPEQFSDQEAAPLLCAGAVGYRSLKLADISDGDSLGLMGFGGSGHLVLQMARYLYPNSAVNVFARSRKEREFAVELGATWSGNTDQSPPQPLHAIIDTTPAWRPVLQALQNLRPGGRLVINAIRKEAGDRDLMAEISYERHLWLEKELKTVANITSGDIAEFLPSAAEIPIRPAVESYPLEDANRALNDLKAGDVRGKKVLLVSI
jgi:propanol-preferring alcohol dehydrogenase